MSGANPIQAAKRSIPVESCIALLRAADSVRADLDGALAGLSLSWARYEILRVLAQAGPLTYQAMGSKLVRHRTSVGVTVGELDRAGLVERLPNPGKRQQYIVVLTSRGRSLLAKAERILARGVRRTLSEVDDAGLRRAFADCINGAHVD